MYRSQFTAALFFVCVALLGPTVTIAEETKINSPNKNDVAGNFKLQMRTLGGKQYWADELVFHNWRIQRNVFSGHSRLLDPFDKRRAWGTFPNCTNQLEQIRLEQNLPAMKPRVVVLLHGLLGSRGSMKQISHALSENAEWTVLTVGYPSTRGTLAEHAQSLDKVIERLEGVEEVNIVAHSLGNLVVRRWLHDISLYQNEPNSNAQKKRPRLGRIVMLAPPNHQPELAEKLVPFDITQQVSGKSGQQMAYDWKTLEPTLATPPCPFGILAGGTQEEGRNPLIAGDDDLVVTVESTKLAGAADFRVLPLGHALMMNDPRLQELTRRFLEKGYFETKATRQPLAKSPKKPQKNADRSK